MKAYLRKTRLHRRVQTLLAQDAPAMVAKIP
jgi:hypothetical protein